MPDLSGSTAVRVLHAAALALSILAATAARADSDGEKTAAKATPGIRLLASKVTCDEAIKVLSGDAKTKTATGEMSAISFQVPDFVTCKAIEKNAPELCEIYGTDNGNACTNSFIAFRELRAHPKGRGYLFTEEEYAICKKEEGEIPYCDKLREAAIEGDPDLCPPPDMMMAFCRAFVGLDKNACRALTQPEGAAEECLKQIDRHAAYAGGLESLAKSGTESQRAFARAALGKTGACSAFEEKAREVCYGLIQKRLPEVTPGIVPPTGSAGKAGPAAKPEATAKAKAADS